MTDSGEHPSPQMRPARIARDGYQTPADPAEEPTRERRKPPMGETSDTATLPSPELPHPRQRAEDEPPPPHARYETRGILGSGGQGIVYRTFDRELRRDVALKTIRPRRVSDEAVGSFLDEVHAAASLDHPNIVPIFDAGRLDDGRPFYTMRLIEGRSLLSVFKALGSADDREKARAADEWSLVRLVQVIQQCCRALQLAHERGILHRDMKPANVLLGAHGEVLVVDWGIAKVHDSPRESTTSGFVKGTVSYMSPEQAGGEELDARSDVYALGVMLFQALTLKLPFTASTAEQLMASIQRDPAPKPESVAGGRHVPPELSALCLRTLAKSALIRPQSSLALHDELQSYVEGMRDRERRRLRADTHCARGEDARIRHDEAVAEVAQLEDELARLEKAHPPWQPIGEKRNLLAARTRLAEARRRIATTFTEAEDALSDALAHLPEHRGARAALTSLHWKRFVEEEHQGQGDGPLARASRAVVERYHDGTLARELQGDGLLELECEPRDAELTLHPLVEQDLVLVDGPARRIGKGSVSLELPMGSYVVVATAPGHEPARYPVCIERNTRWRGALRLLKQGEIPEGFVYIPGTEAWLGGDALATNGWPLRRVHVESFLAARHPVTFGEYCEFLTDTAASAPGSERQHVPMVEEVSSICVRRSDGRYAVDVTSKVFEGAVDELPLESLGDLPAFGICHADMAAYAGWRSRRDGTTYRLPTAEERELLARGVDRRIHPWGGSYDAALCHVRDSRHGLPMPNVVGAGRQDESVHGVRDLAGCIQELTGSAFGGTGALLEVRGGSWNTGGPTTRGAWRGACGPETRNMQLGFRLVRQPSG